MTEGNSEPLIPIGLPIGTSADGVRQAGMLDPVNGIIIDALQTVLEILFNPIKKVISESAEEVVDIILTTPHPDALFSQPSNGLWPDLYSYYWQEMIPLVLFLYGAVIGIVIFLQSTSHLFGSYHRAMLLKRAFTGLLGILSWWWLAGISLRFANSLTMLLAPDLSSISLFETLSFGAMGVLGLVIALSVDLTLFVLIAIIYVTRQLVLYLFVIGMPLLIVCWIPGVGPFTLVSNFARRLANFYVPFLFMTVPVALLFQLADILGNNFGMNVDGIVAWLLALVIPFVALLTPIIFVWQAGAIFFVGSRVGRHTSRSTANRRLSRARQYHVDVTHGRDNFARGVKGGSAVNRDGNYVFGSGGSRAHAAGTRVNSLGARVRGIVPDHASGEATSTIEAPSLPAPPREESPRHSNFESLRGRDRSSVHPPEKTPSDRERSP